MVVVVVIPVEEEGEGAAATSQTEEPTIIIIRQIKTRRQTKVPHQMSLPTNLIKKAKSMLISHPMQHGPVPNIGRKVEELLIVVIRWSASG